jgi:hypothetical protein
MEAVAAPTSLISASLLDRYQHIIFGFATIDSLGNIS